MNLEPDETMSEETPHYPWSNRSRGGRSIKQIFYISASCLIVIVSITIGYLFFSLPDVSPLKSTNPKSSALIDRRIREAGDAGKKLTVQQAWVSFNTIPQLLKDTVRVSEDAGFYQHHGLDLGEIRAAVRRSWQEKKPPRGASTITQQLAKNLYLSPERSLWRKLKELLIARRLETELTKNRIFHLYLNLIEFGPGIFGVDAASNAYFGKPVGALNLEEMVRLVAVIPKPLKAHPLREDSWLKWRARWILDTLERYNYISSGQHSVIIQKFK